MTNDDTENVVEFRQKPEQLPPTALRSEAGRLLATFDAYGGVSIKAGPEEALRALWRVYADLEDEVTALRHEVERSHWMIQVLKDKVEVYRQYPGSR